MAARPKARKNLADLAKKGYTQSQAARELGVSRQRISQLTAVMGLTFRPSYPPVPPSKLRAYAKKGMTQTEAAEQLGVSQKRVSTIAARLGIKFAPVWSRPRPARTPLGKLLQGARLDAGYSYARLAALSGLHRRHIAAIEVGQVRRPTEKTMRALAKSLKGRVTYDQLTSAAGSRGSATAGKAAPKAKAKAKAKPAREAAPKAKAKAKPARKAPVKKTHNKQR